MASMAQSLTLPSVAVLKSKRLSTPRGVVTRNVSFSGLRRTDSLTVKRGFQVSTAVSKQSAVVTTVMLQPGHNTELPSQKVTALLLPVLNAITVVTRTIAKALTATPLPLAATDAERELVSALKGRLVLAAGPLFFASISQTPGAVSTPLTVIASGMAKWLELYSGVLMVRVLLSWFPNIPWERQPLQAVRDMCDPYLNLFRNIIPPLFNALDLSPMLAFMVLGVLTSILNTTAR